MSAVVAASIEIAPPRALPAAANAPQAPAPQASGPGLLRFITCGSVDDGKSTLIGRLMFEAGVVPDDQIDALRRDSTHFGEASGELDYSLLVDGLSAEREQGITIDVAYRYFATPRRSFIVADTPGHEQYTRNMATGASTADVAIILIDARKGVLPQTRRHSFIVSLMGVRRVIVAVNKMDLVDYSEDVFNHIASDYRAAAASLGFASIAVIPVSARAGDNVTRRSERMAWREGPALLELLETIDLAPADAADGGFILPVQWVSRPTADFRGYAGSVARGAITVGADVIALPSGHRSTIQRIVTADGDLPAAPSGRAVTVTLADEIDVSRGDVLAAPAGRPRIRKEATARLLWTGAHGVTAGGGYVLRLGAATATATIGELISAVDIESFTARPTTSLAMNDIGVARLTFDRPLAITDFSENAELGGFILINRLTNETVAFGFILADDWGAQSSVNAEIAALVNRAFGHPGSDRRQRRMQEMSWRLISATIVGALTFWATESAPLSWGLALADLALRPALRLANGALWTRALASPAPTDAHQDGGGI